MPRIERFFAGQKVNDWTSGSLGGGGAAFAVDPSSGTSDTYSGYESRKFTSGGTFTVDSGTSEVDILIVGGGGGGSGTQGHNPYGAMGAGGGGGGVFILPNVTVSATGGPGGDGAYPITVGSGGPGGPAIANGGTYPTAAGGIGGNSGFDNILVCGGGGGKVGFVGFGSPTPTAILLRDKVNGASGGGSSYNSPQQYWSGIGGDGIPGQGNPGGLSYSNVNGGAGGKVGLGLNGWRGQMPPYRPPHPSPLITPSGFTPSNYWEYVGYAGDATPNVYETGVAQYYGGGGGAGLQWGGSSLGPAPAPTRWLLTPPHGVGQPVQGQGGGSPGPPSYPAVPNHAGPSNPAPMAPFPINGTAGAANHGCGGGGAGGEEWIQHPAPAPELGAGGAGGTGVVVVRWAV